jgi:hypothetical protein
VKSCGGRNWRMARSSSGRRDPRGRAAGFIAEGGSASSEDGPGGRFRSHLCVFYENAVRFGKSSFAQKREKREILVPGSDNVGEQLMTRSVNSRLVIDRRSGPDPIDLPPLAPAKSAFTRVGTPACAKNNHEMIGMTSISKFAPT